MISRPPTISQIDSPGLDGGGDRGSSCGGWRGSTGPDGQTIGCSWYRGISNCGSLSGNCGSGSPEERRSASDRGSQGRDVQFGGTSRAKERPGSGSWC